VISIDGQIDKKGGSLVQLAFHTNVASMILNDLMRNGQPQPASRGFRGKEGVEDFF